MLSLSYSLNFSYPTNCFQEIRNKINSLKYKKKIFTCKWVIVQVSFTILNLVHTYECSDLICALKTNNNMNETYTYIEHLSVPNKHCEASILSK